MNHFKHLKTRSLTLTDCNKRWIAGRCEFHTHLLADSHISFSGMKQWNCFLPTKTIHVWHIYEAHNFYSPSFEQPTFLNQKNKQENRQNVSSLLHGHTWTWLSKNPPWIWLPTPWTEVVIFTHQKKRCRARCLPPKLLCVLIQIHVVCNLNTWIHGRRRLVGGCTNPSETYESNWESSPNRGENIKCSKPLS